jgi:hypothetical protein
VFRSARIGWTDRDFSRMTVMGSNPLIPKWLRQFARGLGSWTSRNHWGGPGTCLAGAVRGSSLPPGDWASWEWIAIQVISRPILSCRSEQDLLDCPSAGVATEEDGWLNLSAIGSFDKSCRPRP